MRMNYVQPSHKNMQAFHDMHGKEKNTKIIEKNHQATTSSSHKLERMPFDEDIDAKADAFIKDFKHHLLIQRLHSIN
ncbi:hypothetical protein Lal_00021769 [Lupinus albus]|uniref:Uncharacterized protein n=1 Tax=Lupinus albus TaxID=3870 RepID=A0A6A4ND42_LUPAL|nr:hypothetical protein Lalb_Chr25g0279461 [Lupinus albus]KAF1865769.1 hypothetical protein Lal_00021769 [Lupinus albus]